VERLVFAGADALFLEPLEAFKKLLVLLFRQEVLGRGERIVFSFSIWPSRSSI
jgi:hypothetical protein